MTDRFRLLVVDDELRTVRALSSETFEVRQALDRQSALTACRTWQPHLVVADVHRTFLSGADLCRQMRSVSTVPIIVVSSNIAEAAKVDALDAGADDYVTKPFSVDELLARIRAAIRRRGDHQPEATQLAVGDFRVDLAARRVHIDGHEVRLTPKEFDLFVYLARRPNRVIEHRRLLEEVWGEASRDHPEYLRVYVGQLRKKLEPDPSTPRYLATEPWVGYRFNPSATTA